jgi:allantoinase
MDNPLLPYSPIIGRPPLRLPRDARVAVWIGLNVEHYAFGRPALSLAPFTANLIPDPLNHGWRDYGPRVGVWRLMRILDELGVTPSVVLNAAVCEHYPQIIQAGLDRGWVWLAHGRDNSTWQTSMERDEERRYIADVASTIESATGRRPRGWLGPALTASMNTNDLLVEAGFTYTLDWANDDQPYDMTVAAGRLISVPYSSELNDIPMCLLGRHTAEQFAQALLDGVDMLLDESADGARVLGIGVHPFITGQPFRAGHFARALGEIVSREGVVFATSEEIAAAFIESTLASKAIRGLTST